MQGELLEELEELRRRIAQREEADEEWRRAEEQLRSEKELSESLIRSSPNGILAMDEGWRYTIWNPAMEQISGYPKERCLGRVAFEVFPFLEKGGLRGLMTTALRGESVVAHDQLYIEPGTGREVYFDAYYSPLRGPHGEIAGVLGIVPDVTERKRAEEALRQARDELETRVDERTAALKQEVAERRKVEAQVRVEKELSESLIRSSPNGILAYDRECRYTIWNPVMEEMSSVSEAEALGNGIFDLFPFLKETGVDRYIYAALAGETVTLRDSPYKTPRTGKEGFFEAHYSPLHSASKEIIGGLGILRDITESKQLEKERIRASKLESLSLLAGGLAHDFNNQLTGILGHIALANLALRRRGETEGELPRQLGAAEEACVQASHITQQLLTFAKGGTPVKETASLTELIRQSADFTARGSRARCEFDLARDLAPVEVDPGQISQVINNVILNACQAMPEGGTIRVFAENVTVDEVVSPALTAGEFVRMSFVDQGIGMPVSILEKIFDPYFTTKQQGTGLGLATAYSIVKNHKGRIIAESEVGVGSTFRIYLPRSEAPAEQKNADDWEFFSGDAKILVMDDDPTIRNVLTSLLKDRGFRPLAVADGSEAIEAFVEAYQGEESFAAVVLDLTIAGGLGGRETLERLRETDPGVRAIVASGYSNDPVLAEYEVYGFAARLTKPFRPEELFQALREVLI